MNYLLTAFYRATLLPVFLLFLLFSEKAFSQSCNDWLRTPSGSSFVTVGDLDITGNKLTVEAVFNRTSAFDPTLSFGKIVSKHTDASNVNYALMPGQCEITTDATGYVATPVVCTPKLDKTYHVAMVYDGATLKFYRDGYLLSQVPCTGNLITNNLLTTIGQLAGPIHPANMQLLGFINEVRIWSVARTQAQIRTYMNSSLPATPQTGLAGYYVFNSLQNKQGNAAFDGLLNGAAKINQVNSVCDFVPDSCGVVALACEQSLHVPTTASKVTVGDIDVTGNKLTVEATFNRTSPVNPGVGGYGFLVSKHTGPPNTNYALWPNGCAITTSVSGHHVIAENCEIELNKTYHVAMVYDGTTLKFYRNGFLHSQTPASGNLILNDLITTIGQNVAEGAPTIYPFIGYIDEVRIWNVAKTQQQIRASMGATLPNPATQPGLAAYYTFDNLTNKQGNAAWNGTSVGAAVTNQANPECDFTADSCAVPSPCDKSLSIPSQGSKVTIGDVDVTGNKLTVEAMFNRSAPLNNGIYYGHLVSKHTDQNNVNYALLPNGCEITTSGSGYKAIFQDCPLILGKTYHVAMVYDGATLKFYRNGILLSQVACTGNVVNNNLLTTIGQVATGVDPFDNQFLGYTNEVRIWKEARTQTQIQTYMNQGLPNPTTQTGLVAYYSFNNLDNKQGNIAFNGTIRGNAAIGQKNPDCAFVPSACNTVTEVTPGFIIPDTVCANTPVNISNISINATSYFWSFCAADGNKTPQAANIGNPGNALRKPVFMDYVLYNGNYYGFVANHNPSKLVRLNFGNSLLNTPTATDFGDLGGMLPNLAEGIQIVQNEGRWYGIVVGGSVQNGTTPYIVKIDFGPDLTNTNPTVTNWGNVGNINQPIDLHVFKENGNWYGLTVSAENNTITRFNFTNSFNNIPTAVNYGNIGALNYPTGINAIKHNGNWHVFVTNALGNASLVRLDFGNSLLNTPTAVNLGNPGNVLELTRDLYIMKGCDQFIGFAVLFNDRVVKIDFKNDILSIPTFTSLGNIGSMDFPHSISKLFRVGNDLYSFVTNVDNNTITRFRFAGCEDVNIPNSSLQTPSPVTYTTPGVYNISLTIDEGLPTQTSICKQIVVKDCSPPTIPDFEIPDTVCVNEQVTITNTSTNATSYYWNFCVATTNTTPEAVNLGNIGGALTQPVFSDIVNDNGNYYVFVSNILPGGLVRLSFGNSLLNNPTVTNFGNIGGLIPNTIEGIQVVKNEGRWYAIMVGGDDVVGGIPSRVLKIDFGPNITNNAPVGTNWGNIGNLSYPVDLHVFQENGIWYGLTVNANNNTITRFNFSNSFTNTPTAVNLGNLGGLTYPTGINAVNDNGNWHVFITNDVVNSSLVRLDFGNSLLNTPTAVNLGNPGNVLHKTRDIYIMKACDQITGLAVNGSGYNDLVKFDFNNNILSTPTAISLGNTGNMNFPHSISKLFRAGNDLYSFVTNVNNNTITRIRFPGCSNSSIPNSPLQNPPPVTYTSPGIYNINLMVDEGLPTQSSICKQIVVKDCSDSIIINEYTPVLSFDPCKNLLNVEDASKFNVGDTVLMIQMKGAIIDSTNTAAFGTITNYKNAGNYEFNYVKAKTGNVIELLNVVERQYDIPLGKVQLIRVPYFQNYNATSVLTCLPWDGSKGGVLVFNVQNSLQLNANIDVSGKGFRGGTSITNPLFTCNHTEFFTSANDGGSAAKKGEGIFNTNTLLSGRGKLANGGGGGNSTNSGGAGGGNGGAGGAGGYQYIGCGSSNFQNGGIAGSFLSYTNVLNKIFLGGGGGAGHQNDIPAVASGGNGGGIVIIACNAINTNGFGIKSNGETPAHLLGSNDDGRSGGGAGGTVLLSYTTLTGSANAEVKGGDGDYSSATRPAVDLHGPGGGGGGGIVWINKPAYPGTVLTNIIGGKNGTNININNDPWGAIPGENGRLLNSLVLPIADVPFKQNIDSVRINKTAVSCSSFDFKGLGYINNYQISEWKWSFGDGGFASTQNTNHNYTTSGDYTVKLVITDINGCKDSISTKVNVSLLNFDFNYKQNICNPLEVQFTGLGNSLNNPFWNFGDGNTIMGTANPVHTFTTPGNYVVKYAIGDGVCVDTIRKTISINILQDNNLILTPDTTICFETVKQLRTAASLNFCWSPVTYLDNPNSPNPITSTKQDITYYFTAEVTGANLITNGDFSQGNTGFTSAYNFAGSNTTEGQYFVGANPLTWNNSLSNCKDHSTGNGNMMLINGSPAPDVNIWKQTLNVTPNTNYAFSTWIQALYTPNPAQLQFSINGKDAEALITASLPTCTWTQFYTTWNSGNNTTAVISIVNKNTAIQGNDFALDDISFAPVFIKRDSVKIIVEKPFVKSNKDTIVCAGSPVQLNTSGAQNYVWSPAAGLSNTAIPNPLASPIISTEYIVTGTTVNGCVAKDTVNVNIHTKPAMTVSNDTIICNNSLAQLVVTGGATYKWSPAATLNNSNIYNPVAAPATDTRYYVAITDINTCEYLDSTDVAIRPPAVFSIGSPQQVCFKDSMQLTASGGDVYIWQPAQGLNNNGIANPMASPAATTDYTVTITESVCNASETLSTRLTVMPSPAVTASRSNDIDCSNDRSQLNATGADQYTWTPATTLSNQNIRNPVATPIATTEYIVKGTTLAGCKGFDTVVVKVDNVNKGGYEMPNAFTPNNDGKNDCYGIKYWGIINELEFSIYNRWGERIFFTKNAGQCWDGTYKGVEQDGGVFVYIIKAKTSCEAEVFRKGTFVLVR